MLYQNAHDFIIKKLKADLPDYITYHTAEHTQQVITAAAELALEEKITGDNLILVKTAALFHDTGFLDHYHHHEERSCKIARQHLPGYGYTADQIEQICDMIMATRLPQTPINHLSEILCDADLYYIGTESYYHNAAKLRQELTSTQTPESDEDWLLQQISFLSAHRFFSGSAKKKLQKQKEQTLENLQKQLQQKNNHHPESGRQQAKDLLLAILGAAIAATALKLFLVPNHFFDGGITGISLLAHEATHFNLGLLILLLNLPLIGVSYFMVGKKFAIRTLCCVVLLGVFLLLIPNHPVTADKLLISIFGGSFLGIGIGLIMRVGAALDGIEVLALYALRRTSFTITEIILGINILIFTIAAFKFGIETALYSILTYFTAARCIDYVVEGIQAYTGVTIVSGKNEAIKFQLVNQMGKGVTVYKGERGFLPGSYNISTDCDIVFTIITRLEFRKLKNLVYAIDPQAFIFTSAIKEADGGILKHRKH
ncbi:YitT family protein [Niabella sp.]|uniref:YitT family protein n=1 Tax=Niabella sp. TaxID=1962976 RepID=UPI00260AB599|nr:YitT family protein [Niabella sp.]